MRYTDVRPNIKSGDILVWNLRSRIMWIVSLFTRSKYNHIGVAVVKSGRVFVLEATRAGVQLNPLSEHLPCYLISMPNYWNEHIETYSFSTIGNRYSIWEAILGFFGKLKTGEDHLWQCAELVNVILSSCDAINNVESTPTAIVEALLENGLTLTYLKKYEHNDPS